MINFTKMQALGNDFVVINAVDQVVDLSSAMVQKMADRHRGIGFDQLLVLESPTDKDVHFNYRIFNANGAEVAQCGNGARCVAQYIKDHQLVDGDEYCVRTQNQTLTLTLMADSQISVAMGVPSFNPADLPFLVDASAKGYAIELDGQDVEFGAVSIGNPHVVIRVADLDEAPVYDIGEAFQDLEQFPEQVNVGFMEVTAKNHILLRVYERGVGETYACGSGACAAVAVGYHFGWLDQDVQVDLPGGTLWVRWAGLDQPIILAGPAEQVYRGEWI